MRPSRCVRRAGFHGRSRCTTTDASCRFTPSDSRSVASSSVTRSCAAGDRAPCARGANRARSSSSRDATARDPRFARGEQSDAGLSAHGGPVRAHRARRFAERENRFAGVRAPQPQKRRDPHRVRVLGARDRAKQCVEPIALPLDRDGRAPRDRAHGRASRRAASRSRAGRRRRHSSCTAPAASGVAPPDGTAPWRRARAVVVAPRPRAPLGSMPTLERARAAAALHRHRRPPRAEAVEARGSLAARRRRPHRWEASAAERRAAVGARPSLPSAPRGARARPAGAGRRSRRGTAPAARPARGRGSAAASRTASAIGACAVSAASAAWRRDVGRKRCDSSTTTPSND